MCYKHTQIHLEIWPILFIEFRLVQIPDSHRYFESDINKNKEYNTITENRLKLMFYTILSQADISFQFIISPLHAKTCM